MRELNPHYQSDPDYCRSFDSFSPAGDVNPQSVPSYNEGSGSKYTTLRAWTQDRITGPTTLADGRPRVMPVCKASLIITKTVLTRIQFYIHALNTASPDGEHLLYLVAFSPVGDVNLQSVADHMRVAAEPEAAFNAWS